MNAYADWLGRQPTNDSWPEWRAEGVRLGFVDSGPAEPAWVAEAPPIVSIAPVAPSTTTTSSAQLVQTDQLPDAEVTVPAGQLLAEFLAQSTDGVDWLVDRVVADGSLVAVLGRPESFKSMALLQLGLGCAGGPDWLGFDIAGPRPFVYVSNEKTRATVADRLRRMTAAAPPRAPVVIAHRTGIRFGDRDRWGALVAAVRGLGEPGPAPVVVLDTLASIAGAGFDENSGRDMAAVLGAVRELTDLGATVLLAHHPAKHAEGTGGIRMRGHTSLHGEVDGSLEFTRPDRAVDGGLMRAEPKDGDLALVRFTWDRETFLLSPETSAGVMTPSTIADVCAALAEREPVTSEALLAQFAGHGRSVFLERLGRAVALGLIARVGQSRSTRYTVGPAYESPDETIRREAVA